MRTSALDILNERLKDLLEQRNSYRRNKRKYDKIPLGGHLYRWNAERTKTIADLRKTIVILEINKNKRADGIGVGSEDRTRKKQTDPRRGMLYDNKIQRSTDGYKLLRWTRT